MAVSKYFNQVDKRKLGLLLIMLFGIFLLWNTIAVYPLKVLVVLFHELGHGIAAFATGGHITQINVSSNLGGACWSVGGNRIVVLSAGYLGSLMIGGAILVLAARTRHDKKISYILGIIILIITAIYVRPLFRFGWFFCLLSGIGLASAGNFLSTNTNDFILKLIGLTSCLYAPLDILDDLVFRSVPGSDAYELGRITFIPGMVWGLFWALLAFSTSVYFLYSASKKKRLKI